MNKVWEEITACGKTYYQLKFDKFGLGTYEIILQFTLPDDLDNYYIYVSDLLNVEYDEIVANSIDNAKEQFEEMIIDYLENEICYYEDLLKNFKEEK